MTGAIARANGYDSPVILRPLRSSNLRHSMPRRRCQNWQSAAPPAMVPSRYGLISMTFFTVCERRDRALSYPRDKKCRSGTGGWHRDDGVLSRRIAVTLALWGGQDGEGRTRRRSGRRGE